MIINCKNLWRIPIDRDMPKADVLSWASMTKLNKCENIKIHIFALWKIFISLFVILTFLSIACNTTNASAAIFYEGDDVETLADWYLLYGETSSIFSPSFPLQTIMVGPDFLKYKVLSTPDNKTSIQPQNFAAMMRESYAVGLFYPNKKNILPRNNNRIGNLSAEPFTAQITIPAGVYRLSLYLVNTWMSEETESEGYDFIIKSGSGDIYRENIHRSKTGRYKNFIVKGDQTYTITIANEITLTGIFLSKLISPETNGSSAEAIELTQAANRDLFTFLQAKRDELAQFCDVRELQLEQLDASELLQLAHFRHLLGDVRSNKLFKDYLARHNEREMNSFLTKMHPPLFWQLELLNEYSSNELVVFNSFPDMRLLWFRPDLREKQVNAAIFPIVMVTKTPFWSTGKIIACFIILIVASSIIGLIIYRKRKWKK